MQSEKDMLVQKLEYEFQTTRRVLKAYPADKLDMKPAEKSRTARDLLWIFCLEQGLTDMAVKGKIDFGGPMPSPPQSQDEIIGTYEKRFKESLEKIKQMSDEDFNSVIAFPAGPGKMANVRKADVLWVTLMDMVHHRGQLSVYIRLAGGKVPSIYGPSGDEPWT